MKRFSLALLMGLIIASLLLSGCQTSSPETVRVATDATWPPFEMVDEQSKDIVGFDIDLLNAIAEKENLNIEYINVAFDPLLAGIAQCQYDAAISAMTITEDRQENMLFSDPYFGAGQVIVVRTDNSDITSRESLAGKTVGSQIGTTGAIEVGTIEGATLRTYDDVGLAFQDLMNGQIDAVVADDGLAQGYIGQNSDTIKQAGEPFTNESYGIAVCQDNPELLAQINAGLAAVIEDGTLDRLTEKWFVDGGE